MGRRSPPASVPASSAPSGKVRRRRKRSYRSVKFHRNYSIWEAAKVAGVSKGTIQRWVTSGALPALTEKKPHLILSGDLRDYLEARQKKGPPLRPGQFFCFGCKDRRAAALGMADYVPLTAQSGNLRALCEHCGCIMNKAVSMAELPAFRTHLDISLQQASKHLIDVTSPPLDDHFNNRREPDAKTPSRK